MGQKYIILIIILLGLVLGFLCLMEFVDQKNNEEDKLDKNIIEDNSNKGDYLKENITKNESHVTETDSSGFSDETFLHPTEPQIVKYIPDIEKNPCGFYFEEYEICGGFCPNGQCVSEGLSCYCKV